MRVQLTRNGVVIGEGILGGTLRAPDYLISISGAQLGPFEIEEVARPEPVYDEAGKLLNDYADWVQEPAAGVYMVEAVEDPEPEPLPEPTPEEIRANMPPLSKLRFRLGLVNGAALLAEPGEPAPDALQMVDDFIGRIEDPAQRTVARIYWQDTDEFQRMHPMVLALSGGVGFTEEQTDALWLAAAQAVV